MFIYRLNYLISSPSKGEVSKSIMSANKKIRIEYEMPNERTFQYVGNIVSQDENLIVFNDDKLGIITLNVKRIILIKGVGE